MKFKTCKFSFINLHLSFKACRQTQLETCYLKFEICQFPFIKLHLSFFNLPLNSTGDTLFKLKKSMPNIFHKIAPIFKSLSSNSTADMLSNHFSLTFFFTLKMHLCFCGLCLNMSCIYDNTSLLKSHLCEGGKRREGKHGRVRWGCGRGGGLREVVLVEGGGESAIYCW